MKKLKILIVFILLIIVSFFILKLNRDDSKDFYYKNYILENLENLDNDYDKALDYVNNKLKDSSLTSKEIGYNLLARDTYYYMSLDNKNFLSHYKETEYFLKAHNMNLELVHLYSMITSTYIHEFAFEKAYVYINEAEIIVYRLYKNNNDQETLSTLLAIMYLKADLGMSLNLEIEADKTFEKAESLRQNYTGRNRLDVLTNISRYYHKKKDYDSAKEYAIKSINHIENITDTGKEIQDIYKYDYILGKLIISDAFLNQGNIKDCIASLESTDKYNDFIKDDLLSIKYDLYSHIYNNYSMFDKSIEYLKLSYDAIKDTNNTRDKIKIVNEIIDLSIKNNISSDLNHWYEVLRGLYTESDGFSDNQFLLSKIIDSDIINAKHEIDLLELKKITLNTSLILVMIGLIVSLAKAVSLEKKNRYDDLTKVYNRNYFNRIYKNYLSLKKKHHLIIFDIDNFKNINDTLGHAFGDTVLSRVGNELIKLKSSNMRMFRYGGEEFVILVDNYDDDKILELAETIRFNIENLKCREDICVTVSLGVSHYSSSCKNTLQHADDSLYISKNNGKNRVTFRKS